MVAETVAPVAGVDERRAVGAELRPVAPDLVHLPLVAERLAAAAGAAPHELEDYPRVFDRDYEPMRPETRAALAATFAEPNRRLEALVGRRLGWE